MSAFDHTLPKWIDVVVLPLLNLMAALFVCGLIIWVIGENPFQAIWVMINGAFFYPESLGYTLYYTTNFIFTGLAVAIAFQAKLFNIGGEGQAYLGGLGAAIAALYLAPYLPMILVLPFCVIFCALGGALWASVPGYLQAYRGSHIVITTIMFNFLASALMVWLLAGPMMLEGQQSPQTAVFDVSAHLPTMKNVLGGLGFDIASSPWNMSFILALLMLVVYYVLIWKSRLGYQIRAVGNNPEAAKYAGINVPRIFLITMIISGAFAGMMAANEVLGAHNRVILNFPNGYGFTGIAVALMGRNHPVGIFMASLLFGILFQGGTELDFEFQSITRDLVLVIQGMIVLFSGALAFMFMPLVTRLYFGWIVQRKEA